ncbi:MAG TPA: PAS domain S-box protein, partial [Candidatus Saccharimonadales bacterium]|nr:PAS domain S-box protein [Candidatus Saccharimonadales bacterium]
MRYHKEHRKSSTWRGSNGLELAILAASPDGIAGADQEGLLNFWNPAAGRIFGYAGQDILGKPISLLIPGIEQAEHVLERVKHGETVVGIELKGRRQNGEQVDVALNISPVVSSAGGVMAMSIAIQDITERKQAEMELRDREQRFSRISHATNDATYDWDVETDNISWDPGITELFGYKPEEVEPSIRWWHEHLHPSDQESVMHRLQSAMAQGAKRWSDKYRFRCSGGNYAVVVDRGFFMRDAAGKVSRLLGGMTDVTENERAVGRQSALIELGDRLRAAKDFEQIAEVAGEILGRTLEVARAGYATVDSKGEQVIIIRDWTKGEVPGCPGHYRLEDLFAGGILDRIRRGETVASDNSFSSPPTQAQAPAARSPEILARIYVPLVQGGKLADILYVHDVKQRHWLEQEVGFAQHVADRTWAAVQRAASEQKLRESETQLRTIADLVPDLLWRHDPQGESNWHNRRWAEFTGQSLEQSRGTGWLAVTHPDERAQVLAGFQHAMATGKPVRQEIR